MFLLFQVRAMSGPNDHPTAVDAKMRLRLLLMGAAPDVAAATHKNPGSGGTPVALEEEAPTYLSAQALDLDQAAAPGQNRLPKVGNLARRVAAAVTGTASSTEADAPAPGRLSLQGLAYVAGYLAFKCKAVDPSLGSPTCRAVSDGATGEGGNQNETAMDWIGCLSRGGLTVPTAEWLGQVMKYETVFADMHGENDMDRQPGVVRRLVARLQAQWPSVDGRIVKKYAVTRTHLRLRWLQRVAAEERRAKQHAKRTASQGQQPDPADPGSRRTAKRMRMYNKT